MIWGKWRSKDAAHRILDRLELPTPWNSHTLAEQIAELRERPITLAAVPSEAMSGKKCGLWINTEAKDYLLYPINAPQWFEDLVICHELSHILFRHDLQVQDGGDLNTDLSAPPGIDLAGLTTWLPDLEQDAVKSLLGRSCFTSRLEFEAEYLATQIVDRGRGDDPDSRRDRMFRTFLGD
ncbi:hypothetical protein [Prescottella agglutinans]|uniref:IrrE N-terminal-like domain-containing protein n=1 Tax=Prescottella agglutinans TaxID=1644129 RepID=A0ABT6MIB4_9NOCA|nr:hypothetical protein [Prescottella agglutinans]MDH6283975.1 hypothetical protein [Prescottella agglutinans]